MFEAIKSWFKKLFGYPVLIEGPPNLFPEPVGNGPELPPATSKGKIKLGIIVGHEKAAQGAMLAEPYNKSEYEFNNIIAKKAQDFAAQMYPMIEVVIILRDGIGISGAYTRARQLLCDVVIELHFNAYNGQVKGTEVLCTPASDDVAFAQVILKQMCKVFGRTGDSRGVQTISKSDRGGGNVHGFPGGANCLVEPFFGDNKEEADFAMSHIDEYAQCLIVGVALWGKQVDLIR